MATIHTLSGLPPRTMDQQPTSVQSAPRRSNIHTLSDLRQTTVLTGSDTTGINQDILMQLNSFNQELVASAEKTRQCQLQMAELTQALQRLEGALNKQDESVAKLRTKGEELGRLNKILHQEIDREMAKKKSVIFSILSALFQRFYPSPQDTGSSPDSQTQTTTTTSETPAPTTTTQPPMDMYSA
jgi:septal ring factor EnvC (AmiA/AmiB activator)